MVAVLVILDGASEPVRDGEPTSRELVCTSWLDRLARAAELERLRTVAPGLVPGSEVAVGLAAASHDAVHRRRGPRLSLVGPAPLPKAALASSLRVRPRGAPTAKAAA